MLENDTLQGIIYLILLYSFYMRVAPWKGGGGGGGDKAAHKLHHRVLDIYYFVHLGLGWGVHCEITWLG